MPGVDALPVVERNEREESGHLPDHAMNAPRAKQRLVPALVKDREPLHERDGKNDLTGEPEPQLRHASTARERAQSHPRRQE